MESTAIRVPMEVEYAPAWLTWVAATTTCLRALGIDCDQTDVAGFSGYAFHLCIHKDLCPSGPTVLNWDALNFGVRFLGRSTLTFYSGQCHSEGYKSELTREHCRSAFEMAKSEIVAGRPCVIWGAYVPEFAACMGVDGDAYLVKSFKECINQEQPPIPFDEINAPGGAYVLGFPNATDLKQLHADQHAVLRAVEMSRRPSSDYVYGPAAYDMWADALRAHRADSGGNAYNAACYAEGRRFAGEFLERMAKRNEFAAGELNRAAADYAKAADATAQVAKLFPFPGEWGEKIEDDNIIGEAAGALKAAKDAESDAIKTLTKVTVLDWPKP